jgi:hypothetical protein
MDKKIKNDKTQELEYRENLLKKIIESGFDVRENICDINDKSVLDLVVFKGKDIVLILETKITKHKTLLYGKINSQIKKYQEYNLPILICNPLIEDDFILKIIKKAVNKTCLTYKDKRYKNMKIIY